MTPPEEKKPRRRVKKVRAHAVHHGGAWKVAYADFVTAMMALFLVLWLVSQADTKMKQAIANYFRSPGVFDQQAGGIIDGPKKVSKEPSTLTAKEDEQALLGLATALKKKFNSRPEFSKYRDQIKIDMTDQGLRIQILDKADNVSFASGSAELTPEARAILEEIARAVCALPNPLLIGGHTDKHVFPPQSTYTNWELSADRANAARRTMEETCVPAEQIGRIVGYADTEPLIPEDPYAVANRRISITVMRAHGSAGLSSDDPGETGDAPKKPDNSPPGNAGADAVGKANAATPHGTKSVSVGLPDKIPERIRRSREPARPIAVAPSQ